MKYKAALLFIILIVACLLAIPAGAEPDNSKDARLALLRLTKSPIKIERATSRPDRVPNQTPIRIAFSLTPAAVSATPTSDPASSSSSSDIVAAKGATATIDLTPSSTAPPKVTATRTPSATTPPTLTSAPTETPLPTATSTATPLPTSTATEIPSQTPSATDTPTDTPTAVPTFTFTATPTNTYTPTFTATATNTSISPATQTSAPQHSAPTRTRPAPTSTFGAVLPSATSTFTLTPDDGGSGIGNPTNTAAITSQEIVIADLTENAQAGHQSSTPTFTATAAGAPVEAMIVPVTAQPWAALPLVWYFACGFLLIALLLTLFVRLVIFKRKS